MNAAAIDRLSLNTRRIDELAGSLLQVLALPDPIGEVITAGRRPNGLDVSQVRVPLGVIFMIYESRPNVTVDAAALCVKSGNAVILRGGKEAIHSNRALHRILADELQASGLPEHAVQLVPTIDRAAVGLLLGMPEFVDLAIPRGGESLIRRVVAEARDAGDETLPGHLRCVRGCRGRLRDGDPDHSQRQGAAARAFATRRKPCSSTDRLQPDFLPRAAQALMNAKVELRGDEKIALDRARDDRRSA